MSRQFQESQPLKPKGTAVHPIWRGIGCIMLVIMAVGGYWAAGYLLDLNQRQRFLPFAVPYNFSVVIVKFLPALSGRVLVQLGAMILVDIFAYAIMVIIYGIFNPPRLGPQDSPPLERRKGRKSMTR